MNRWLLSLEQLRHDLEQEQKEQEQEQEQKKEQEQGRIIDLAYNVAFNEVYER